MKYLSFDADPDMRWMYDYTHPDYNGLGKHLRERRDAAIRNAPEWMKREAQFNDAMRSSDTNGAAK